MKSLASHIDYRVWCSMVESTETAGLVDALPSGLKRPFEKLFAKLQNVMLMLSKETKTDWAVITKAFATKSVFEFFRAVAFSITRVLAALKAFARVYQHGLLAVFHQIAKTKVFEKLQAGVMTVDEFLNDYPIFKKLAGPAIAGFMVWCFLHANFTWHPDLDMDFTPVIKAAFNGDWSFSQLLATPQALLALTTLFSSFLGITVLSPIWLAGSSRALLMALFYTGLKHMSHTSIYQAVRKRVYTQLIPGTGGVRV